MEAIFLYFAVLSLLFSILFFVFSRHDRNGKWRDFPEELPPTGHTIRAYPVALYDEEYGIIVDMADWIPRLQIWHLTESGRVCHPLRWYDLPDPALP